MIDLLKLADLLDSICRNESNVDNPEKGKYIIIPDILAKEISKDLREFVVDLGLNILQKTKTVINDDPGGKYE